MEHKKFSLNMPFPYIERKRDQIMVSLLIAVFVYLFLLVFQPFGLDTVTRSKSLFISAYFFITFSVIAISFLIIPLIFKKFSNPETWSIKKILILSVVQVLIVAILNTLYTAQFVDEFILAKKTVLEFIFITFSVAIIPVTLLIILVERFLTVKNKNTAKIITENIIEISKDEVVSKPQFVTIGNKNDSISLNIQQLVYIKSDGNYSTFFYMDDNLLKNQLIRFPISKIMHILASYDSIKHCHRSYIVNFNYVTSVSGNARNYGLILDLIDFEIPVSRNFSREIIQKTKEASD